MYSNDEAVYRNIKKTATVRAFFNFTPRILLYNFIPSSSDVFQCFTNFLLVRPLALLETKLETDVWGPVYSPKYRPCCSLFTSIVDFSIFTNPHFDCCKSLERHVKNKHGNAAAAGEDTAAAAGDETEEEELAEVQQSKWLLYLLYIL